MKHESPLPLEIHDLTVSYEDKPVLYGIDLEISDGVLVGIIGPNGAGKSTLIQAIMGMVKPLGGWVKIFGQKEKKNLLKSRIYSTKGICRLEFPSICFGCGTDG